MAMGGWGMLIQGSECELTLTETTGGLCQCEVGDVALFDECLVLDEAPGCFYYVTFNCSETQAANQPIKLQRLSALINGNESHKIKRDCLLASPLPL